MNSSRSNAPPTPDESEFVSLLIRHQDPLRAFIGHLVPTRDAREDVLQEVNMLLWEKRGEFERGTNFRAWAYTFARYVAMRLRAKIIRDGRVAFRSELVEILADEYEHEDPDLADGLAALRNCLERVSGKNRDLLLKRYSGHGEIERLAGETGQSAASLRGRLFRLRTALRRCVEREMNHNPALP